MSTVRDYEIYLRGFPKRGIEPTIAGLIRLFGLDVPRAFELVRSLPRVVKHGVPEAHRERYEAALRELGADFEVRPTRIEPQRVVAVSLPEPAPEPAGRPSGTLPGAVPAPRIARTTDAEQRRVTFEESFPDRATGEHAAPAPSPSLAPPVPPALVGGSTTADGSTPPIAENLVSTTRTRSETVRELPLPDAHAPTMRDQPAPQPSRADAQAPTLGGTPAQRDLRPDARSPTLRESVAAPAAEAAEPAPSERTVRDYGWSEETAPLVGPVASQRHAPQAQPPVRPASQAAPVEQPRVRPSSNPALYGVRTPVPSLAARGNAGGEPLELERAIAAAASSASERAGHAAQPEADAPAAQPPAPEHPGEIRQIDRDALADAFAALAPRPATGTTAEQDAAPQGDARGRGAPRVGAAVASAARAEQVPTTVGQSAVARGGAAATPMRVGAHDLGERSPLGVAVEEPAISPLMRIALRVALGLALFVMVTSVQQCSALGSEVRATLSTWDRVF